MLQAKWYIIQPKQTPKRCESCFDLPLKSSFGKKVMEYWLGKPINQYSIMDVGRSTNYGGTLSVDMVRIAHFSRLSSSLGTASPENAVNFGFPNRPRGLVGVWFDSQTEWVDQLLPLIANDIPVICLMHFQPNG